MFTQMTKPRRSRVNNFNPRGWWILYINAGFGRINVSSARSKHICFELLRGNISFRDNNVGKHFNICTMCNQYCGVNCWFIYL